MAVGIPCFHCFGQPYARLFTEPPHTLRAALRHLLEAGGR
jgi:hypothetical protein